MSPHPRRILFGVWVFDFQLPNYPITKFLNEAGTVCIATEQNPRHRALYGLIVHIEVNHVPVNQEPGKAEARQAYQQIQPADGLP